MRLGFPQEDGRAATRKTRRYRRIAVAVGITGAVHLVFLALFVFSATTKYSPPPPWTTSYQITLVRLPRPSEREKFKPPKVSPAPPRMTRSAAAVPIHAAPVVAAPTASPVASPISNPKNDAASDAAAVEGMRKTLHGLAACHPFGMKPTEKERAACEDRLGRIADATPHIDNAPPPQPGAPPQKANTCRFSVRTLLSPRVKCKFW
jgi:hypothetical protein